MAAMCGSGRASFIVGPSTRNQRIDRMWRDVFRSVCHCFCHIFYAMEECQLLDIDNIIHLSLLHLIFIPRINYAPEEYQKLFIQSTLAQWYAGFKQPTITDGALDEDPQDLDSYTEDPHGPTIFEGIDNNLSVSHVELSDADAIYSSVFQLIDPLAESFRHGY